MKFNYFFRLSLNFHIETISRPGFKKDSMMNTITTLPQKIYSKLYCDPGNNLKTPWIRELYPRLIGLQKFCVSDKILRFIDEYVR